MSDGSVSLCVYISVLLKVIVHECCFYSTFTLCTLPSKQLRIPIAFALLLHILCCTILQATEPASLVPLIRGCEQLILVGDQNQLPPTILSRGAAEGGLATSLFNRLMYAGMLLILLYHCYTILVLLLVYSIDSCMQLCC
jgi:AAA domain